jgi:hypothetical protein
MDVPALFVGKNIGVERSLRAIIVTRKSDLKGRHRAIDSRQ